MEASGGAAGGQRAAGGPDAGVSHGQPSSCQPDRSEPRQTTDQ